MNNKKCFFFRCNYDSRSAGYVSTEEKVKFILFCAFVALMVLLIFFCAYKCCCPKDGKSSKVRLEDPRVRKEKLKRKKMLILTIQNIFVIVTIIVFFSKHG